MPSNEILEEIWDIKDSLWTEAGGDMRLFCEQLREWASETSMPGSVLHARAEVEHYLHASEPPVYGVGEEQPGYGDSPEKG